MALNLRRRTILLEQRIRTLEAQLGSIAPPPAASVPEIPPAPLEQPATAEPDSPQQVEPEATIPPPEPTGSVPPIPVPAPASPGWNERLGSRWAVWVGGLALALGGLFLVRYSIEQGLLGPGARVAFGAAFALALLGAGEWLRRRNAAPILPGLAQAHVPSVLTAAGTSTAFATAYAAYALYGLIGPALTFVLLGAVSVLTMLAAALHGPRPRCSWARRSPGEPAPGANGQAQLLGACWLSRLCGLRR